MTSFGDSAPGVLLDIAAAQRFVGGLDNASEVGVPMRTLMEWMGHRDLTTLIYADYMSSERARGWVEAAFVCSTPGTELSETQRTERT